VGTGPALTASADTVAAGCYASTWPIVRRPLLYFRFAQAWSKRR